MLQIKRIFTTMFLALAFNLQAGIGVGESAIGPLPVELTSFSASVKGASIVLNWTTATEVNNYGFYVESKRASTSSATASTNEWETVGFVEGHGNSNSPKDYSFIDSKPLSGSINYRLKQIDTDGKFSYSTIIELNINLLKEYILEQNYPNPFNPTTVISYSIPTASHVTVKVFDVLGKIVTTLVKESQEAGSYKVTFNASKLSNGVYFYKIIATSANLETNFSTIKKMILLK